MEHKQPITIILDNGHGKETPGKRSPNWEQGVLYEWEYTRRLVHAIQTKLIALNIPSYKLVLEPSDVPLSERARRVNEMCKNQRCILISVHLNAGGGTGWEVWSTTSKNNSDHLADCFCGEFSKIFPKEKLRGAKEENYTLLYKSNCPCVITENFFMDYKKDYNLLNTVEGFNKIVDLHVKAIQKYLEKYP